MKILNPTGISYIYSRLEIHFSPHLQGWITPHKHTPCTLQQQEAVREATVCPDNSTESSVPGLATSRQHEVVVEVPL